MTEPMDIRRFELLVAAYGATPNRWPDEERVAAETFARSDPRAAALLAEADTIDELLFRHRLPAPSRTLRALVVESAPRRRRLSRGSRFWWLGVTAALAAAGGAVAGSAAVATLSPAASHLQIYEHDDVNAYDETSEENAA